MKASPSDQKSILDIQRFDQASATLRHRANTLSEIPEIASTTIKANNARDLRIAAQTELSDVKRELLRAEGDVEQIVTRITRDEARLAGGSASPKELEQLQHEVGTLGARKAELEEVELEIMMRVDEIKDRATELANEEATLAAVIADLEIRKENALAAIHSELDAIKKERIEISAAIDLTFLELYEKVRAANSGTGAAALAGNQCLGCHLPINAAEVKRINDLPEDEVTRCEECRCILVRAK